MKYMGSKRAMLTNGLHEILKREIVGAQRFVDLFAGSGAVAVHVAESYAVPVVAYDLQLYSSVLSGAILRRRAPVSNWRRYWDEWYSAARTTVGRHDVSVEQPKSIAALKRMRAWCAQQDRLPICRAYGGYYFSPLQSVWIDALRKSVPKREPLRSVAIASLIRAASRCTASPGHTAQPLSPSCKRLHVLSEAWSKSIVTCTLDAFDSLTQQHAVVHGRSVVADANKVARYLREGDLVFVDPPYSGVHYSRFYHVLETIAAGRCGTVSGSGRYPSVRLRPRSLYSMKGTSAEALEDLLYALSERNVTAILTFPAGDCSNGLSGRKVRALARTYFNVESRTVYTRFSSLGGNGMAGSGPAGRAARMLTKEMILTLRS